MKDDRKRRGVKNPDPTSMKKKTIKPQAEGGTEVTSSCGCDAPSFSDFGTGESGDRQRARAPAEGSIRSQVRGKGRGPPCIANKGKQEKKLKKNQRRVCQLAKPLGWGKVWRWPLLLPCR